jgi:hypothetical protein
MVPETRVTWPSLCSGLIAACICAVAFGCATLSQSVSTSIPDISVTSTYEEASRLVVMIDAAFGSESSYGAGIVFAVNDNRVLIVTADHIVRSYDQRPSSLATEVKVRFKDRPSDSLNARVLDYYDPDLDLAILEVAAPDLPGADSLSRLTAKLIIDSPPPKRGDAVFPIGYPKRFDWGSPVRPDVVDRVEGNDLYIQSSYVQIGHSGGGVFDANWRLVGMVLSVAQTPTVRAITMNRVLTKIKEWGLSIGRSERSGQRAQALVVSEIVDLNQLPAQVGRPGIGSGPKGMERLDPQAWVRLEFSKIEQLPPVQRVLGSPHYAFLLTIRNGNREILDIENSRSARSPLLRSELIDGATVHLIDHKWLFADTELTVPAQLGLRQLLQGQLLRLPLTSHAGNWLAGGARPLEVTFFLKAKFFDPNAESGPDQFPETPKLVGTGGVFKDRVSFSKADATDHYAYSSTAKTCSGLLFLYYQGRIGLSWMETAPGAERPTRILHADSQTKFDRLSVEVYKMPCGNQRTVLRVQAEERDSEAEVFIHLSEGKADGEAFTILLQRWVEFWANFFGIGASLATQEGKELLGLGVNVIAESCHADTKEEILVYEKMLKEHHFPTALIERNQRQIELALQTCCTDARRVRMLIALLRAEQGVDFDRDILKRLAEEPFIDDDVRGRARSILERPVPAK